MGNLKKFLKAKSKDSVKDSSFSKEEFGRTSRRADLRFCQESFRKGFTVEQVLVQLPKHSSYARECGKGYIGRLVKRAWRAFCREHNLLVVDSYKLIPSEAVYLDMSDRGALFDSMTVESSLLLLSNAVSSLLFLGWTSGEVKDKVERYCGLVDSYKENQQALLQAVEVGQISMEDYARKLAGSGVSVADFIKKDDDVDPVFARTRTVFERCNCEEHSDI